MPENTETKKVKVIKQRYENEWLSIEGVTAIGIGYVNSDNIGIIISVNKITEAITRSIPQIIDDIPIKIQETGEMKAFQTSREE